MKAKDIIERGARAKNHLSAAKSWYDEAMRYFRPTRVSSGYDGLSGTGGRDASADLYDSTAQHALERWANRVLAAMFPTDEMWVQFEPSKLLPDAEQTRLANILQDYQDAFFGELKKTNFSTAIAEFMQDFGLGTAILAVRDAGVNAPLQFDAIPCADIDFEDDPLGQPRNVFRNIRVTASGLKRIWGDAIFSKALQSKIDSEPEKDLKVLEATIAVDDSSDAVTYYVVVKGNDGLKDEIIVTRSIMYSPWIISRYSTAPGDLWGTGPALNALADVRTLNEAKRLFLKQAELDINPPYMVNMQQIRLGGALPNLKAGDIIPVTMTGGAFGKPLEPLPTGGRYDITQLMVEELRMGINKMLGDTAIPADNRNPRSATEISERIRELAQNNAGVFGRTRSEVLRPLVIKIAQILTDRGALSGEIDISDNNFVDIVPQSPIARADKQAEIESIVNVIELQSMLGVHAIDTEEAVLSIARLMGVDSNLLFSDEERDQIRQSKLAAAQTKMAVENGLGNGDKEGA